MKILLFRVGGIGDVILTTPLIRQLKKKRPSDSIDYLVGKKAASVLKENPYLRNIITFNENIIFKKEVFAILKLILKIRKEKYDTILVLGKHWLYHLISFLFRAPKRIGFKRKNDLFLNYSIDYKKARHEVKYYLDLLKGLRISPDYNDRDLEVYLRQKELNFADNFFKKNNLNFQKTIIICPGGGINQKGAETTKRWPKEKWVKLIKLLKNSQFIPLLIGGKTDKEIEKYILKKEPVLSLIGKTSLLQAGAIIKKSRAVVSSDSGLAHLGAALNEKVLSIFGPTDPKRFAPLNKNSKYLFNNNLKCSPCYDMYGNFNIVCDNQRTCFKSITPELVFKNLKNII